MSVDAVHHDVSINGIGFVLPHVRAMSLAHYVALASFHR